MDHLENFLKLMPATRVIKYDDMLVYSVGNIYALRHFENKASNMIMRDKLPLVVETETWRVKGIVRTMNLVIMLAPEAVEFRHEPGEAVK